MNRIYDTLKQRSDSRFHFFYGPGTHDLFVARNLVLENFIEGLNSVLLNDNFDRIVHISPTNIAHCKDDQSKSNSAKVIWPRREVVLQEGIVQGISTGPFGIANGSDVPFQPEKQNPGLGDLHGIRMIDELMRDNRDFRTACVIYDAITFCDHFDARRILLGILNEWLLLPGDNFNECFYIVPVEESNNFYEQIKGSPLSQFIIADQAHKNLVEIGFPNDFEIRTILYQKIQESENNNEINQLVRMSVSEKVPLRTWIHRVDEVACVDVQSFRMSGWLRSSGDDPRSVDEKLNDFIGLDEVKDHVKLIQGLAKYYHQLELPIPTASFHMVFYGSPGTGKTSIARLFGQIFQESGMLKNGHLREVKGSDLIADHVGGTGVAVNRIIDQALDGILFIDEAYSLSEGERGGFGREAVEVLLKRMDDERDRLVVILAGYKNSMQQFFKINPGLERRFPPANRIEFPDFSLEELGIILAQYLNEKKLLRNPDIDSIIDQIVERIYQGRGMNFGNAGEMRNLAESIDLRVKARVSSDPSEEYRIYQEDIPDVYLPTTMGVKESLDEILSPLDMLVGMGHVRQHLISLAKLKMLDAIHHENQPTLREKYLDHFLFLGNPGTGKTTTARLVGEVFNRLGFLKTRNLVEVSAVDLIAGYVGQTPERTRKVVESAFDGILFIDEAYSLIQMRGGSQDGFGKEVIDTLVKLIDQYRNRFVVIMAGYPDEMIELVHSNPGLSSRFTKTILFPDFTDDQLGEIFLGISNREGYVVHDEVLSQVKDILNQTRILSPRTFGNARDVHRLFRHMVQNLANRIISYPIFDGDRPKLPQGWNSFVIQDVDAFDVIVDHNPSIIENYPYGVEQKQMKKRKL